MPYEHRITRRVEFSETDMAGIVHFSNFFRYFEAVEHDFYRSMGFTIDARDQGLGWPRVEASCSFRAPLRFEDVFEVWLLVAERRERSLRYHVVIRRGETEIARGAMTTVCVRRDAQGQMRSTPIPEAVAARIEPAPAAALERAGLA
jgi:YbgC/YbaW family acyl-CoA thioester hydrolase